MLGLAFFASATAHGGAPSRGGCEELELTANLTATSAEGTIRCVAGDPGARVATYPRLFRSPDGLTDINRFWSYPQGFDAAEMELWLDDGTQLDGNGGVQTLPSDTRSLHFRTRVPRRNGTFGRRADVTYLLGGWHPAFFDGQEIARTRISYRLTLPQGTDVIVGNQLEARSADTGPRVLRGEFRGQFLPVVLAPRLRVRAMGAARVVIPEATRAPSRRGEPDWHLRDVGGEDRAQLSELAATLGAGAGALTSLGVPEPPLLVVVTPIQESLVELFDGGFAIAERTFHLLPFEQFLKFHRMRIWRAQLQTLLVAHLDRRHETLPLHLAADAAGCALRDRLVTDLYGVHETAADILDDYAVIPEIDALVFAPQVAFQDTYYEAIDETPRVRRQLDDFSATRPRGKLIYEKLVDHLGRASAYELFTRYLVGNAPLLASMPDGLITPWLGAYPRLDYAITSVAWEDHNASVDVTVTGPDAAAIREPISIAVQDSEGHLHTTRRLGPGTATLPAHGGIEAIELDPDHRLVELARTAGEDPRYNNRIPPRWRFLLNNITGLLSVTNGELTASADFTLRRIHDLRNEFDFYALYSASSLGLGAGVSYAFGEEITPLRLGHTVGIAAAYERLRSEGAEIIPGDQGSVTLYYHHDTRLSAYSSFEGEGWAASAVGAYGVDTDGTRYPFAQLGAGAFKLVPLSLGHALLGRLRADLQLGEAPPQNGLRLGGRYRGGRGFEADEARGEQRIVLSGEYRHLLEGDGHTDFWGLLTFTRIEGAAFADAVFLPIERPGCAQDLFYDVGYGLRFFGEILNLSPATIQVDVGVPLDRCPDESERTPMTVYVALLQSFASF